MIERPWVFRGMGNQGSIFVADEKYLRTFFIVDNFLNVARGEKDLGKFESTDCAFSTYMHT